MSIAFGKAVRKLRKEGGYTQEGFAHHTGIDRAYFGLIERGGHTPTIATAWKIAEGLGIAPNDLIIATENELATAKGGRKLKKAHAHPKTTSSGLVSEPGKGRGKD